MTQRIVISEDQLEGKFLQACRILAKVRYYRKKFEDNHDGSVKKQMKDWEERADVFLETLETEPDPNFVTPEKIV